MDDFNRYLEYDPLTGQLTWRPRTPEMFCGDVGKCNRWNGRHAGKVAGNTSPNGYSQVQIMDKNYRTHRVIWAMVYGVWPDGDIDHINGVRDDNRLENLRVVDRSTNLKNMKQRKSHITGVYRGKSRPWRAIIQVNGEQKSLGSFDCFCDALKARKKAEKEYGFHENHGRFVP